MDENRGLFLNPNHDVLYLLILLPKNKGHREKVHNQPKLHLTGTQPGQNNFCQTSNIRKSNTGKRHFSCLPSGIVRPASFKPSYSVADGKANQGKINSSVNLLGAQTIWKNVLGGKKAL